MTILALKHICLIPFVRDEIMKSINSVAVQQAKMNLWSLFGVNPTQSSLIELLVFVTASFAVVDQLAQVELFPADYYTERFRREVRGFPEALCEGVIDDPEEELHMRGDQRPSLRDQTSQIFGHIGVLESTHSTWILLTDMVSFVVLLACWSGWTPH
jgi:hypothetical protein